MSSSSPSNTTTTAENKAAATPDNPKRRPCLPPGLELLLLTTTSRVPPVSSGDGGGGGGLGQLTPFTATVLVVHWSIVRNISENKHFRLIPNEDDVTTTTEVLPADWRTRIGDLEGCACLTLQYRELSNGYEYSVKLIELVKDKTVVVVCNIKKSDDIEEERLARQQRAKDRGLSTTTLVQVDEFIDTDKFVVNKEGTKEDIVGVFKVQGVWELQSKVQNVLLNCSLDEGCEEPIRSTPIKPPYSSNLTAEQKERLDRERKERRRREDEEIMRQIAEEHRRSVPPPGMVGGIPVMPFQRPRLDPLLGDFGRSDLDPFGGGGFGVGGGIGGGALGGMLMDPRGFRGGARGPHLPPGVVPPGARFDPIGPFGGGGFGGGGFGGGGRGGRGGGAAGGIPFGLPNPDHERVPDGLDDMFT